VERFLTYFMSKEIEMQMRWSIFFLPYFFRAGREGQGVAAIRQEKAD
jgi:hypothetical protein